MILFFLSAFVQIGYWTLLFIGLRRARSKPESTTPLQSLPPVSVIVAARNEQAALPRLLSALKVQSHPSFEVIIVDDVSDDRTADITAFYQEDDERIRLIRMESNEPPRKKRALTCGIEEAGHELLALTDADCKPPPTWLEELARSHAATSEPCIITGYSPYRQAAKFREKLASFETFVTGILTTASAALGKPYMALGRNISYPRSVFEKVGGFAHSMESLSGDDDLFVQEARRHGICVQPLLERGTFVMTDAPSSWTSWLRQKRRHASAGRFYDREMQFHLIVFHATDLICWLAPLFLGWTGMAILGGKLLVHGAALSYGARLLNELRLLHWFPLLGPAYAVYITVVEPFGVAYLPERWQ